MASSFWHGDFYFDNKKLTEKEKNSSYYKVCIIDYNSHDIVKQIGGSHIISIDKELAYHGQYFYKETEISSDDIILQLARTDKKPWTATDIIDIGKWLFTENFCKFQPTESSNQKMNLSIQGYNIMYYLKAVDLKKFLTPQMEGYLEITFKQYDGYAYAIPQNSLTLSVGGTKTIKNISNVDKIYYPKIKITNNGDTSTVIKITNKTNNNVLTLKGMGNKEVVTVDCAMGVLKNSSGKNRFSLLQDYGFLGLVRGNNNIQLSGDCKVELICEFPIIM